MDLLIGKNKALLIDSGYGDASLSEIVCTLTDLPLEIVITHAHRDHMGGIFDFEKSIWLSEDEYEWIMSDDHFDFFKKVKGFFKKHKPLLLNTHQSIDLGGIVLETVKTPGHTPGSMSFYNRQTGELFTGDSFGPGVMIWQPLQKSLCQLKETEDKIVDMNIRLLWLGHDLSPKPGSLANIWREAANSAKNPENYLPMPDNKTFVCCESRWRMGLKSKNMEEIYKDYIFGSDYPDFSCLFIKNYFYI